MAEIRQAQPEDWEIFYRLATTEGWLIPQIERRLFHHHWQKYAYALRDDNRFCGLVTAVAHQKSGWIGNLLIPPELRGLGYGTKLFKHALTVLHKTGLESIWLTASAAGRLIYAKNGFHSVDQIERWLLPARQTAATDIENKPANRQRLLNADRNAWGEERLQLLQQLCNSGRTFNCDDAVALLQNADDLQIIGPMYRSKTNPEANRLLLQKLLAASNPEVATVVDLHASAQLSRLFASFGFIAQGESELMVYGDRQAIDQSKMLSLASLGSVG